MVDGRGLVELGVTFLLCAAVFLAPITRVAGLLTEPAPWVAALPAVVGIAVGLGLAGVALTVWDWARNGGRAAQRLGRRAWRSGRLPEGMGLQVVALRDLRRRERLLRDRGRGVVTAVVWALLTVVQIAEDPRLENVATWTILLSCFVVIAVRGVLDRRNLPELQALLSGRAS